MESVVGLWRRHWVVLIPCAVFLFAHTLVAHKEERFLYPILGIEMWVIAYLWSASSLRKMARRIYTPAFFAITVPALLIVCFINTQEGEIEPPAYAESHFGPVAYLDHESLFGRSRFQFYFLRRRRVSKKFNVRI